MKTAALIASLSRKERRQFEQSVLLQHKRTTLKKLYQCLKKQPQIHKEAAFVKTFGTAYDAKQDHLFRNELRLLNKALESFLIQVQWEQEQAAQPHQSEFLLLKVYLNRGQFDLFEPAWRKLYKKVEGAANYDLMVQLLEQYIYAQLQIQEVSYELFEQLHPQAETLLRLQEAHMAERFKKLEVLQGFIQQNLYVIRSGQYQRQRYVASFQQQTPLLNNTWLQVLEAAVQMYYLSGSAKIDLLTSALAQAELLENTPHYDPILIAKLRSTLALEYFIDRQFEQADRIYSQLIQYPEHLASLNRPGLFFNYLSNLVNLERYEDAIRFYQAHQTIWETSAVPLYRVHYFLCWAYLGLGDYEAAQGALLLHDLQDRPRHEEFYARTLLSLVYYHLGELIMAERETYNLLQNYRYKLSPETTHYEQLCYIHQFYVLMGQLDDQKRQRKLEVFLQEVQAYFHDQQHAITSPLIQRWLQCQIKQAM